MHKAKQLCINSRKEEKKTNTKNSIVLNVPKLLNCTLSPCTVLFCTGKGAGGATGGASPSQEATAASTMTFAHLWHHSPFLSQLGSSFTHDKGLNISLDLLSIAK